MEREKNGQSRSIISVSEWRTGKWQLFINLILAKIYIGYVYHLFLHTVIVNWFDLQKYQTYLLMYPLSETGAKTLTAENRHSNTKYKRTISQHCFLRVSWPLRYISSPRLVFLQAKILHEILYFHYRHELAPHACTPTLSNTRLNSHTQTQSKRNTIDF